MAEFDVEQAKIDLAALGAARRALQPERKDDFRQTDPDAGPGTRVQSQWQSSGANQQLAPTTIVLDKPFMIWPLRNYAKASHIMMEDHYESMNSWAKIKSGVNEPDDFLTTEELTFYFFWSNDTGGDALVNVSTLLAINGSYTANAYDGWIWSPFWGTGTIGESAVTLTAKLNVLEWWNQPPTSPDHRASQYRDVAHLKINGDWTPLADPAIGTERFVSDTFHLNYDAFSVPVSSVAVFEVTLHASYEVYNGYAGLDFSGDGESILCPYVRLDVT